MNEKQKRLFEQMFRLLDSDQVGERAGALEKLHALRTKMGWPSFGDLLTIFDQSVPLPLFTQMQANAAQWQQAYDQQAAVVTALSRQNAALRVALRIKVNARWLMRLGMIGAGVAFVVAAGLGGWWWYSMALAKRVAIDAALGDVLARTVWRNGDATPRVAIVNDTPFWVLVRGTVDDHSISDAQGRLIIRHCLTLYGEPAERDGTAYRTASPYGLFSMNWTQRAAECRLPGTMGYQ